MPIYAYRCAACGHARDVLQKISDPLLTVCPACGAEQFQKQVTAAGFQLKGSGWYVTDFRNNGAAGSGDKAADKPADKPAGAPAAAGDGAAPAASPSSTTPDPGPSTPAAASTAPPAASIGGCGTGCACH